LATDWLCELAVAEAVAVATGDPVARSMPARVQTAAIPSA
jgi:hypothetical protein